MSSGDILLRVLNRENTDRVPVAPFIHANFVKAFYKDHDIDVVQKTVDVYDHFGFDLIHRNCTPAYDDLNLEGDGWRMESRVQKEGRNEVTACVIHTPGGTLEQIHRTYWISEYDVEWTPVDYLIKSEQDFDLLQKYQPPVGRIDTDAIKRAKKVICGRGLTAPWVQGAFNFVAYFYRSLEHLVMDAMLDPGFYHRMMTYFLQRNKQIISQFIDAGVDMLSYGGNIASGKMVGLDFFRDYVFPYEKQLIDYIQGRGVHVLYHNCGYASALFTAYRELGMHVYESLTPAPFGDTVLEDVFNCIGPEMILHGHFEQIEFLRKAAPDQIARNVEEILHKVKKRGRFILGTSDYFNEDTPHENVRAFADAARRFGRY